MAKSKSGFTLIELLVVIAIIAILAAILFPVFAQAKAAAKAAATISNIKQQSLAHIMYSGDYDDLVCPAQTQSAQPGSYDLGGGLVFTPWTKLIYPYMKNTEIFGDPLGPNFGAVAGLTIEDVRYLFPRFGLNWNGLNTATSTGLAGVSMTAAANPADTVMLTTRYGVNGDTASYEIVTYVPSSGPTYDVFGGLLSFPPAGIQVPANWGKGGDFDDPAFGLNPVTGRYTAGIALRHADNIIVAWVDGHVNKKKPGQLGAGTGFRFDKSGANTSAVGDIAVPTTDPGLSQYLWDLQ